MFKRIFYFLFLVVFISACTPTTATPPEMVVPVIIPPTSTLPLSATQEPMPIPEPPAHCREEIHNPTEPIHAVHMGGNWGTSFEPENTIPPAYFEYLRGLNVNWVGISVALHYEDSMDSTVERVYSGVQIPTFTDDFLRKMIRTYHQYGICVYLTLAFEAMEAEEADRPAYRYWLGDPLLAEWNANILPEDWPWAVDHPDHKRFEADFWESYTEQTVHFGQLAEEEGVGLYSLGTETDRLFRTRRGGDWPNDFGDELRAMTGAVRKVYHGPLTYDMVFYTLTESDYYGPGSEHLWEDLGLDVIGISAYFPLADYPPSRVLDPNDLEVRWEFIFRDYLIPLQAANPDRPIYFTEFGAVDSIRSPYQANLDELACRSFSDDNENGIDDGEETQANIYQTLYNVIDNHPGVLNGTFLWGMMMADYDSPDWSWFSQVREFSVVDKLSEDVVREFYGAAPNLEHAPTYVQCGLAPALPPIFEETGVIYDDLLAFDWWTGTWNGEVDVNSSIQVFDGTQAMEIGLQPFGEFSIGAPSARDVSAFTSLVFYIYASEASDPAVVIDGFSQEELVTPMSLNVADYVDGGQLKPGQWQQVVIPMSDLNPGGGWIRKFRFQEFGGNPLTFYIDQLQLMTGTTPS